MISLKELDQVAATATPFYSRIIFRRILKTLLKLQTQQQLGIVASSLQLTVSWTTVKMSTCFSTRKMRRNAARSPPSTVPRTTVQMSTSRSSQSAVPQTTARTSTRSIKQQQLKEAASCLPEFDMQLHQREMAQLRALWEDCPLEDNTSSPSKRYNKAS